MDKSTHKILLWTIIYLAVLGIVISSYLAKNHLAASSDAPCDITPTLSCSFVNASVYSVLFNVPVAIFAIVWFLIEIALCLAALARENKAPYISALVGWNLFGVAFVVYLIIAEIILGAMCPYCTVLHVIIVLSLCFSILLQRDLPRATLKEAWHSFRWWILVAGILFLIPLILFNSIL